jgi:hypothetical protein
MSMVRCIPPLILLLAVNVLPTLVRCEEVLQLRPDLYFGVREPNPESFAFGLGWFHASSPSEIHYDCREPNEFTSWGFEKADSDYGLQRFRDKSGFTLTTEHVFSPDGGMLLRVNGSSEDAPQGISLLLTLESPQSVSLGETPDRAGLRGDSGKTSIECLAGVNFL